MTHFMRLTVIAAVVISTTAVAHPNVEVTVDGEAVTFQQPVLMVDMLFPILPAERFLNAIGATMEWNPVTGLLVARRGATTLQMTAGANQAIVDGVPQTTEFGAQSLSGRPYVPGAATARLLGLEANWEPDTLRLVVAVPVEMPEGDVVAATLLEIRDGPPVSLVIRSTEDDGVYQVPLSGDAPMRRGRVGLSPMRASLDQLQPGDLLEIILSDEGTAAGVTATYAQAMGTIANIQGNRLQLEAGQNYPLGSGVSAIGSDGQPLHLLGAVGEAAILTVNPHSNEVWSILSQRRGSPTPPPTEEPIIAGFVLPTYYSPLRAGESLDLRIIGSAGGRANVAFGATGRSVTVSETQPGLYTTSFTVPTGMNLAQEPLVAQLLAAGQTSSEVQSDATVLIDTVPPTISELEPADRSETGQRTPVIRAQFEDQGPAGLDRNSLAVAVNGRDVLTDVEVQANGFTYTPPPLAPGMHSVSVSIADNAGNTAARTWHFRVTEAEQAIQTVQHDAQAPLRPGDTITVTMNVTAAGRAANFAIEGVRDNIPMTQVAGANQYVGTHTVAAADRATDARVRVSFTDAAGREHTAIAPTPVNIFGAVIPLAVTTPADGARVGRQITPEGTAPPGSRVRWTVTYRRVILAGEVGSGTVIAGNDGVWRADRELNLSIPIIGIADAYAMTAELLDQAGTVQRTLTVNFRAGD